MKDSQFYKQAELLLRIIPIVNGETVFALKGGTAINFFVRDLPRLSVDIDLVYLPVKERVQSLEGITDQIRKAFIVYLISHNRPIAELLNPNLSDIKEIYEKEFTGMTAEKIELEELIKVREQLVKEINRSLTENEKEFLISFKALKPKWDLLGLPDIEKLPAVNWKLLNLRKMDKEKYSESLKKLENTLLKKL